MGRLTPSPANENAVRDDTALQEPVDAEASPTATVKRAVRASRSSARHRRFERFEMAERAERAALSERVEPVVARSSAPEALGRSTARREGALRLESRQSPAAP